jgi:hypothetical protein
MVATGSTRVFAGRIHRGRQEDKYNRASAFPNFKFDFRHSKILHLRQSRDSKMGDYTMESGRNPKDIDPCGDSTVK